PRPPRAVPQPHRPAAEQVDRRVEDGLHGKASGSRRNRASSASPPRALFSGWNCTPWTFARPTTAAIRTPEWSATACVTSAAASQRYELAKYAHGAAASVRRGDGAVAARR